MSQIENGNVLPDDIHEGALLHLLSNPLILCRTVPNIPVSAVLSLAATSRAFRDLIYGTPQVFRYLDLTAVKIAQFEIDGIDHGGETWRNVQLDENLTEEDFYSGPLRGVLSNLYRSQLHRQVQTLVLDGLAVTAELIYDILIDPSYNIRILSLREVKHLNESGLRGALKTACRPSRPAGTPKLKALYIFGPRERSSPSTPDLIAFGAEGTEAGRSAKLEANLGGSALNSLQDSDPWYLRRGKILTRPIAADWARTLVHCRGIVAFDAILCNGPRHYNSPALGKVSVPSGGNEFAIASYAIDGCESCGSAPEGWTIWGEDAPEADGGYLGRFPLLGPPPLFSSDARIAMCPSGEIVNPSRYGPGDISGKRMRFIARCAECLRDRYCHSCYRWWCEACLPEQVVKSDLKAESGLKAGVAKSCWECGNNCHDCIAATQRVCRSCCGGYCIIHNEGSTLTMCDWCSGRGRRIREIH